MSVFSTPGWAEIEQIFYYSIPGSLLIFYTLGFLFGIHASFPIDGAFLAAMLLASIPVGFVAYQAYTSNLLWIHDHIWKGQDTSDALHLIEGILPVPTSLTRTRTDLAKRVLIMIGNERDPSGYRWKLLNLANSRGVRTFATVVGGLIPFGWIGYRIAISYAQMQVVSIAFLSWDLVVRILAFYAILVVLGSAFYRAISKILRQLDTYSEILIARNLSLVSVIAAQLQSANLIGSPVQGPSSPSKPVSEYTSFLRDTVAVFAGVLVSKELGAVPVVLGILLPALVVYMIFLILVDAVAKPRMKKETAGRMTNALVRVTRGIGWLANKSATFVVGAGLQLLLATWNPGGAALFIILAAVGVLFVWQGQLLRKISSYSQTPSRPDGATN